MKKVFVNVKTNEEQRKRLEAISSNYQFVYEKDEEAAIIVGNYPADKIKDFKNLEWFQASAVGVDAYIKKGVLNDNTLLTNAVDIHSEEVAEHILGLLLEMVKRLHSYRDNQKNHCWKDEGKVKSVIGLKVAIIGFGDIGNALAKLLKGLKMEVVGVKRKMIEKPAYLDKLYLQDEMDEAIKDADVIVTVLPGTKENYHLFNLDTFKKMKKDAILINAGRGNLYSEEVLKEVLDQKIIAGVAMDVFEKEPLLEDSPLWDYDNLVITPHVAGFFHLPSAFDEFLALAEENLRRYEKGEELKYLVNERE